MERSGRNYSKCIVVVERGKPQNKSVRIVGLCAGNRTCVFRIRLIHIRFSILILFTSKLLIIGIVDDDDDDDILLFALSFSN